MTNKDLDRGIALAQGIGPLSGDECKELIGFASMMLASSRLAEAEGDEEFAGELEHLHKLAWNRAVACETFWAELDASGLIAFH